MSQASRILVQLATLAVLSRILPPKDFGLLAMATVVTTFATLLRDMGTAAAIIQRETLGDELLNTIFWFNICLGIALGIGILFLAIPIASVFREPRLSGVLAALAVSFPLASAGAVHQALLERALRFRTLARIEISSALVALFIAIIAAISGLGVYALVLNTIAIVGLTSVQLWFASRWRPTGGWSTHEFRTLWGFSSNLVGFQVLNYFARNADTMLIGRFLGADDVGLYNMGYRIMLFPLTSLSAVVTRALFPVLSRRQSNLASFGSLYLKTISAIFLVTAPLMAGLWVLREPFVEVVFGRRWVPVADILAWLAPVGMIQSILTTVGLIYMATGSTRLMIKWGVFASVVSVVAIAIGLRWGYLGVARSYAVAMFLLFYPAFAIPLRRVGLSFTAMLKSVFPQLISAIVMAIVISLLQKTILLESSPAYKLSLLTFIGAAVYLALGYVVMRSTLLEIVSLFRLASIGNK
jgi:O-antigen/teichoic acid export membrane protein